MKTLLVTLALCGVTLAQDCPLRITDAFARGENLGIEYQNTSNKTIKAVKFSVVWMDAVGDEHPATHTYTTDKKTKSGKKQYSRWSNWWNRDNDRGGAYISVIKVMFDDGTTFDDDGVCKEFKTTK